MLTYNKKDDIYLEGVKLITINGNGRGERK